MALKYFPERQMALRYNQLQFRGKPLVHNGVPRGIVLEHPVFYVTDLLKEFRDDCDVVQFADDSSFFKSILSREKSQIILLKTDRYLEVNQLNYQMNDKRKLLWYLAKTNQSWILNSNITLYDLNAAEI